MPESFPKALSESWQRPTTNTDDCMGLPAHAFNCVQERLRTLRASLGSARASQTADTPPHPGRGIPHHIQRSVDSKAKRLMQPSSANRGGAAAESTTLALHTPLQSPGAAATALNPSAGMVLSSAIAALIPASAIPNMLNTTLQKCIWSLPFNVIALILVSNKVYDD